MAVGTTALLIGAGAFSAGTSLMAGNEQAKAVKRQGEHNALVYEQQAEMLKEQKKIQDTQFNRNLKSARGKIIASTAGKGLMLSGSPLAVLADTESQMQFDKAISDYNSAVETSFAKSSAAQTRYSASVESRLARYSGFSNAFSNALSTGVNAAIMGVK